MSNPARSSEDQERQIVLLLDGQLSAEEAATLAEQIAASDDLRTMYLRYVKLHAQLSWCHGAVGRGPHDEIDPVMVAQLLAEAEEATRLQAEQDAIEKAAKDAAAAERRRQIEELQQRNLRRVEPIVIPYGVLYAGGAALAAAVVWMVATLLPFGDADVASNNQPAAPDVDSAPAMVATVIGAVDASWSDAEISCDRGARLPAGLLQLSAGVVHLRFDDGAEAFVEAPAELELMSASRARVESGKLVGRVPPRAIGFTVETPSTTIVDLGTEFGVDVASGNDVEVHVFSGRVTATMGQDQQPGSVVEGQAVRIAAASRTAEFLTVSPERFIRRLPPSIQFVGIHEGVGEYLRTTAVTKPLDADGDDVYGTAGFYFFNSNDLPEPVDYTGPFENMLCKQPEFVDQRIGFDRGLAAAAGVYSVRGMPDYLDIDNPLQPPGEEVDNVNSGILSYDQEGSHGVGDPQSATVGSEIELCRIALGEGVPHRFRLGLFADNGDLIDTVPRTIRVSIAGVEQVVDVDSRDLNGDVYLFDVELAQPGDMVVIHLVLSGQFASIGGLVFDVPQQPEIPIPGAAP